MSHIELFAQCTTSLSDRYYLHGYLGVKRTGLDAPPPATSPQSCKDAYDMGVVDGKGDLVNETHMG